MTSEDATPSKAPPTSAVLAARKAGYSDDEIAQHLSADPRWFAQMDQASQAGYSPTEIVNHLATPNVERIKSNIKTMIDQGAPESELDAYVTSEGVTPAQLRAHVPDTSFTSALTKGASDVTSGIGRTLKRYVGADDTAATLDTVARKVGPGTNYKPATESFMHPDARDSGVGGFGWKDAPRAIVESLPGLTTDVLAALVAKRLGGKAGAVIGGMGSYALRTLGNEAEGRAQKRTGNADAEPTAEDKAIAATSTLAQGALNQIGLSRFISPARVASTGVRGVVDAVGNAVKTGATEGATNAAQDAISQIGQTILTPGGVSVDPHQVVGSGALGMGAGTVAAGPRGARDITGAVRFRDVGGDLSPASAAVANRILERAGGDLTSLKDPKAAYRATADASADVTNELVDRVRAMRKATTLSAEAANALNRAQQGRPLNDGDLKAISDATEGVDGGNHVNALARQAAVLSRLTDKGNFSDAQERFGGGVSDKLRSTAKALMIPGGSAIGAAHLLAGSIPAAASVASSAPIVAGGALASYGALRAVERKLGLTSPAHAFAEKFGDGVTPVRPADASEPQREPERATGPKVSQWEQPTPWGTQEVPTPRDIAKRSAAISRTLEKALGNEAKAQNRADASQDRMGDYVDRSIRAQVMGERKVQQLKERADAASSTKQDAAPKPRSLGDYPEAPWSYESPKVAADMALDYATQQGTKITSPEGYRRGAIQRMNTISDAFGEIANTLPQAERNAVEVARNKMLAVRSESDARSFRQVLRDAMPNAQAAIDRHLSDAWIRDTWTPQRSR